jgi:hypothetical protein
VYQQPHACFKQQAGTLQEQEVYCEGDSWEYGEKSFIRRLVIPGIPAIENNAI